VGGHWVPAYTNLKCAVILFNTISYSKSYFNCTGEVKVQVKQMFVVFL